MNSIGLEDFSKRFFNENVQIRFVDRTKLKESFQRKIRSFTKRREMSPVHRQPADYCSAKMILLKKLQRLYDVSRIAEKEIKKSELETSVYFDRRLWNMIKIERKNERCYSVSQPFPFFTGEFYFYDILTKRGGETRRARRPFIDNHNGARR